MSDESEEAYLVNSKSPFRSVYSTEFMSYTDSSETNLKTLHPMSITESSTNNSIQTANDSCFSQGKERSISNKTEISSSHVPGSSSHDSHNHESESGELVDYNDEILLSQFHTEVIKKTGCGKFQIFASIIIGLGLAGHAIHVYAVYYILPSAELEYCILDSEKSWLILIALLGLGCGALIWGGLASRAGRRKTLLSCLSVSGIFSMVAAFMPTYGPFMMARFCAAMGIGGVIPAGTSYICETSPVQCRARLISLLGISGLIGGIFTGGIAILLIPQTGQMIIMENNEHFSAWHRYLLIITIPTFISIFGLFALPESPRWLLESGRDVEALTVYQKIYHNNKPQNGYTLTELELPRPRTQRHFVPSSVLAGMAHAIRLFFTSFLHLFTKSYLRTTLLLFISWTAAIFVFHGLTIFISHHSKYIEEGKYKQQTQTKFNKTYENMSFNNNIDNLVFNQCTFINCTFRRIFISHVQFKNCSFMDTEFTSVKTSQTDFVNCILEDVKLIDIDLRDKQFINTINNNTEIIRLSASCNQDFEYNIFTEALWTSNLGALVSGIIAVICIGEAIKKIGKVRSATLCFIFSTILSCAIGFLIIEKHVLWIGGIAQGLIIAGLVALTVLTIETYSTSLRCTAIGFFIFGGHISALISTIIYASLPVKSTNFAAGISALTIVISAISSAALKEPCILS